MRADTLHATRAILVESLARVDALIAAGAAEPEAAPTPTPTPVLHPDRSAFARAAGFTGDTCRNCGGAAMRRAGTCLTCTDCGSTTGCS